MRIAVTYHHDEGRSGDIYGEHTAEIYVHECNAYCNDDIHATLVWTIHENFSVAEMIEIQAGTNIPIDVLAIRPALEAPEFAPGGEGPFPYRFLVHFRWLY